MNYENLVDARKVQEYVANMRPNFNKRAVFSDETENYRTPVEPQPGEAVNIRIRTKKNNVDFVYLICGEEKKQMNLVESKDGFDYYGITLQVETETIHYYFEIISGKIHCFYNKSGVTREVDEHYSFGIVPGFQTPDWAKGAVMYQIFVDRFCNGDASNDVVTGEYCYIDEKVKKVEDWNRPPQAMDVRDFYGGDLQGVWDKLDYLQDLGVEVIYFNPVFVSPSNHKYDCQDYDYIDPHYGKIVADGGEPLQDWDKENAHASKYIQRVTRRENLEASNDFFARLVEEIHRRGMKVILDGVFNHCGSFNKWLDRERIYEGADGYEPGAYISEESPYRKFFQFFGEEWPYNGNYDGWWGHDTLPKLNYEESVKLENYILSIGKKWVSPPYNIDGWRLDVAADLGHSNEYNHEFWKKFRETVKSANPDAIILAEHYGDPSEWLQGDEWDTVMNYPFYLNLIDLLADEKINVSQFVQNLGYLKGRLNKKCYPLMWNLIDSHDTARFLHLCHDNKKKQHLAAAFQLLLPGMPMVYYGDEYAMPGANDPDCRRGMYWDEEYQDKEMYEWYKQLLWIRKKHACISEGELIGAITKDEEETIVLIRKNVEETIALIFNCSSNAKNFSEYEGKYNLLRDEPFNGKVEGLDAAVIVL